MSEWAGNVLGAIPPYKYDLCWLVSRVTAMMNDIENLKSSVGNLSGDVTDIRNQIAVLEATVTKIKNDLENGNFSEEALRIWADKNMPELIAQIVKYVMFGLSLDGHFIALIPESWQFIRFDTIADPESDLFGHLILQW